MRSNRVTLAELITLSDGELADIPLDQLYLLQEDVSETKSFAEVANQVLRATLERRFGDFADKSRKVIGKDTGTVRWDEGDYMVVADKPKAVVWNQDELAKAEAVVRSWGENPEEYLNVKRSVSEDKWAAWPSSIRQVFERARTVKHGKCRFELLPKQKDAA